EGDCRQPIALIRRTQQGGEVGRRQETDVFGPFLQNSRSRIDIASCKLPKQPDELSPRCILDQLDQNALLAASPQDRANLGHSKLIGELCDVFLFVRGRAVLEARLPYP